LTPFHTRQHVPLTLHALVAHLWNDLLLTEDIVFIAVVLVSRYICASRQPLTMPMLHRLLATSIAVSIKTHSDHNVSTAEFARSIGVTAKEMVRLELALLTGLDWHSAVLLDRAS
jgi:hypothetical protein